MFCPKERDSDCFHVSELAAPACIDLLKDLLEKNKKISGSFLRRIQIENLSENFFFLLAMNLILTHFH